MKPYVKPELFLEEFELSQSVAACGWDLMYATKENCYAQADAVGDPFDAFPGDLRLFTDTNKSCNFDGSEGENYCYEVSTLNEAFKVFRS